jgi:hypothetical protein
MSIRSWGYLIMNDNVSNGEKIALSFQVNTMATKNKIGIKFGWNVPPDFRKDYKGQSNVIPFELVDNPMTNVAEILFGGDGVTVKEMGKRVDTGESLELRILRVQKFLEEILQNNIVREITLHIAEELDEEETLEIKPGDFKEKLIGMYSHDKTWTPSVKIIIKN